MNNVKLPHWAFLLLGLISVVITWAMNRMADGTLVLPAVAITALTILRSIIGLLTPSVVPSTNVAAVKKASLPPPGPSSPGPLVGVLCLVLAAFASGCGFLTAAVPGIINIVDAECARAEKQPTTPGWIDFLCTVVNPRPGEAATFTYRVPESDAEQFASMHVSKKGH